MFQGRAHSKKFVEVSVLASIPPSRERVGGVPQGTTSRIYLIGEIGFFFLIIAALARITSTPPLLGFGSNFIFLAVTYVLFIVGGVLVSFGFYGFRRYYGSLMGLVTFIISMVLIWFLLIQVTFYVSLAYGIPVFIWSFHPYTVYMILWYLGLAFFGVTLILWGSTFIVVGKQTDRPKLGLSTGILLIVTGAFSFIPTFLIPEPMFSIVVDILLILTSFRGFVTLHRFREKIGLP